MVQGIKFDGMAERPNDYDCPDGQLALSANLICEDGAIKPIANPAVVMELPAGHEIIAKHKVKGGDVWLMADTPTRSRVWYKFVHDGQTTPLDMTDIHAWDGSLSIGAHINTFSVLGNTIVLATDGGVKYLLWEKHTEQEAGNLEAMRYRKLNSKPPFFDMMWTFKETKMFTTEVARSPRLKDIGEGENPDFSKEDIAEIIKSELNVISINNQNPISYNPLGEDEDNRAFNALNRHRISQAIMASFNKVVDRIHTMDKYDQTLTQDASSSDDGLEKYASCDDTLGNKRAWFCMPFFVRYAYRMFDGSLICHSAPILMHSPDVFRLQFMEYANPDTAWTAQRDDDGNCTNLNKVWKHDGGWHRAYIRCQAIAGHLAYVYNYPAELDDWKDLITSVDIFISKPIYSVESEPSPDEWGNRLKSFHNGLMPRFNSASPPNSSNNFYMDRYFIRKGESKFKDEIEQTCNFFLVDSISIEKLKARYENSLNNEWKVPDITGDKMLSLESRECMTDDYQTLDTFVPSVAGVFNNRALLGNVSRKLFEGFSPRNMQHLPHQYQERVPFKDDVMGEYVAKETETTIYLHSGGVTYTTRRRYAGTTTPVAPLWYLGSRQSAPRLEMPSVNPGTDFGGETTPQTSTTLNRFTPIPDSLDGTGTSGSGGKTYIREVRFAPGGVQLPGASTEWFGTKYTDFFWYPDPAAYKMIIRQHIFRKVGDTFDSDDEDLGWIAAEIDLKPHAHLNGAYAYFGTGYSVKKRIPCEQSASTEAIKDIVPNPSKIYLSEISNPFHYPLTGITTIGNTTIHGVAMATQALSQGQFGQHPMYAFTDEGLWALSVTSTGTLAAAQPISRDIVTEPKSITNLDTGVIFSTSRGLMLLEGAATAVMTDLVNNMHLRDYGAMLPGLTDVIANHAGWGTNISGILKHAPLSQWLVGARIVYDYPHQRLIIFNPTDNSDRCLVYSLRSQKWGEMTCSLSAVIPAYPEALAMRIHNGVPQVLDFSAEGVMPKGVLVSRPIKCGSPDILKRLDQAIVRGYFRRGDVKSILWGSRDLYDWQLIWSSEDHYLRGFSGTPWKYFRIGFITDIDADEAISGVSMNIESTDTSLLR